MRGEGGLQYLYFVEFLSISDLWDLCFLDFIVLESKGSFFHDFANEQHFWDYTKGLFYIAHLPLP